MIGILTCGLPSASNSDDHAVLRALGAPAGAEDAPGAHVVDVVAPVLRQGVTIVAIVPAWDLEPTLAQLQMARSGLDCSRLVVHRTSLPPLAAGAFAFAAAELTRRELLADGVLVSCLGALERQVVGAAWLGTVARLREPAPQLSLHARSYLPGASFGAVVDDQPRVVRLQRHEAATIELPATRVPGGWRITVAQGQEGDSDLIRRSITRHAPGATTERVPLGPISTSWWGTDKLVELALVPADLDALARSIAAGVDTTRCSWCGDLVATDPCPFCGARATAAAPTPNEVVAGGRA